MNISPHFLFKALCLIYVSFSTGFSSNVKPVESITNILNSSSLEPKISDIPSTFTFRASCIKKTYMDGYYKTQLEEPKLVRASNNGIYTLFATCLNGLGVPIKTKIKLKLIIRHIGDIRTISIRSIVDASKIYRNCADIANRNGVLECIPAQLKK